MKDYIYQNNLIGKKELRQLLAWSFTNYDSMQACSLADVLKYLGFKYATQAGISISIEDLKIPFVKNLIIEKANQEIINAEKIYLKGKITDVERFQKLIDTWNSTSESLKNQIIVYFRNYDPLNSVYIMAFSGARGNLSQVRQLVGMRGLMSDPSGQIMNLPIKKNFREGLTITDYLMSGYGARKGIVDTALKTANSGYLTRRLIDVAQDILIREKDCLTNHALLFSLSTSNQKIGNDNLIYEKILGRVLNKSILDSETNTIIVKSNTQITPKLIKKFKEKKVTNFYLRSPLTCNLYRSICQKCYGWDLASENLVDIGEAIGILAGQSIGEPGTQLTMRTFHTGGVFTSKAREKIISPVNGIVQFYKFLKTVLLRTNRGEDVLLTKTSGSLIVIPDNKTHELIHIKVSKNTILFPKNNQYILKNTVIGELINNREIKTEIKPILSDTCGEIFIPPLKQKVNLFNNNKLVWILSGQLYSGPSNSFLNFFTDYKINPNSYIFRTKIINHYNGVVKFINDKKNLYQRFVQITENKYSLFRSKLEKLELNSICNNYLLNFANFKYLLTIKRKHSKNYLQITKNHKFATLLTNSFRTLTGGILYYDCNCKNKRKFDTIDTINFYYHPEFKEFKSLINYKTIIWLGEEIHKVNCEQNILFVESGDFISNEFELIPGIFSKTSGLVTIGQKNNVIKTISIKSGLVYEGKEFEILAKKLYYPGEVIFSNIVIEKLSFCELISRKNTDQLVIRPIEIYEFPYSNNLLSNFKNHSIFELESKSVYFYKSNQYIKGIKNLNLIFNVLKSKNHKSINNNISIELSYNQKKNSVDYKIIEKLSLNNYISPKLKYKHIQSCFLVQENQFVSNYSTLGYLEAITSNKLEIVKFKTKNHTSKEILLISNNDCLIIKKEEIPDKKLNDFITTNSNLNNIGKIIIENKQFCTIQKGRPYFFPNCNNEGLILKTNLQYKILPSCRISLYWNTKRNISLNYFNIFKLSLQQKYGVDYRVNSKMSLKSEFSKVFLKNNGKLYSCLIPQFFKKFTITNKKSELKCKKLLHSNYYKNLILKKINRTLLMQSSEVMTNQNKINNLQEINSQLALLKFVEQPFTKTTKSVGLYSVTEDYFEQDVNSVFCKNTEFVEAGRTIGLLNLEKEITGDIVQGLPRIEEILEARKKNVIVKRIPTSKKKGLVIQKTNLDIHFEFKKLGTSIKENDKINPHKLLKVYFDYYGLMRFFLCDRTQVFKSNRLINNYEGIYKSFKKVQLFILNSVQSVYQSQGVTINDKHLEVIIKQMTTKVLITYEGDTPLLKREVIDLYHIQYINKILQTEFKQPACYIPFLLGITKAALNNPSFISAASFQETTRVLTKASIEGRIDWLRGLKENIIIGHLIPAGTGSQNYRNCFQQYFGKTQTLYSILENLNDLEPKPRQVF